MADRFDQARVSELVREKLAGHEGEWSWRVPVARRRPISFEAYALSVEREMLRRRGMALDAIAHPPPPGTLTIKSWQYGLSAARDPNSVDQAFRNGLWLALQAFREGYLTSSEWRACLDAQGAPSKWRAIGDSHEAEGRLVLANAAYAAARWLAPNDPAIDATIAARPSDLPERFRNQPVSLRGTPFRKRHWLAWDMKNYGLLDLPSLLESEHDHNFSVRARIYRSIGQRPHPAAIEMLQEATFDPHPFARAQAVRSLGWIGDPSFLDELARLGKDDPHPEVRRTAELARQRIAAFWLLYGEWDRALERSSLLATSRRLADLGLFGPAHELACSADEGHGDSFEPADSLERLMPQPVWDRFREGDYAFWFREADASERKPDVDPPEEELRARARERDGWDARRRLRRCGIGSIEERRWGRVS